MSSNELTVPQSVVNHCFLPKPIAWVFANVQNFRTALLIVTVAAAALTLIPHMGMPASLGLRSLALISGGTVVFHNWSQKSNYDRASNLAKLIPIALVLISTVSGLPYMTPIAFGATLLISSGDFIRNCRNEKGAKAAIHALFLIVNAFALAAILSHSWPVLVTASSVGIVAMLATAITVFASAKSKREVIDGFCYLALAGVSLGGAIRFAEFNHLETDRYDFKVTNENNFPIKVYDTHGNVVATLNPYETAHFSLAHDDALFGHWFAHGPDGCHGEYACVRVEGPGLRDWIPYSSYHDKTVIDKAALPSSEFQYTPIGQTAFATSELMDREFSFEDEKSSKGLDE